MVLAAGEGDALALRLLEALGPEPYPGLRRMQLLEALETLTLFRSGDAREDFARRIHAVQCKELVPWALGYSDPVRDRVEARQREAAE